MKKIIKISIISLVSLVALVLISALVLKLIWISNARKYAPYLFTGSTWVCNDPEIVYEVPAGYGESTAKTVVNGKEVEFELGTLNHYVEAVKFGNDHTAIDAYFTGFIIYKENRFIIYIDKSSDQLFDGKYSKLVFYKQE